MGDPNKVKIFPGFAHFLYSSISPKRGFYRIQDRVTIYTPKGAQHIQIFLTGGSSFARQKVAKIKDFLGEASL
jgi:hypothetical protein